MTAAAGRARRADATSSDARRAQPAADSGTSSRAGRSTWLCRAPIRRFRCAAFKPSRHVGPPARSIQARSPARAPGFLAPHCPDSPGRRTSLRAAKFRSSIDYSRSRLDIRAASRLDSLHAGVDFAPAADGTPRGSTPVKVGDPKSWPTIKLERLAAGSPKGGGAADIETTERPA